jgi:membrane fusion protein (multidrug efflux system)
MVVDDQNKVSVRTVRIGDQADKEIIVLEGLNAGERVIVEGMQKVRPGGQVNPSPAPVASDTTHKPQGS